MSHPHRGAPEGARALERVVVWLPALLGGSALVLILARFPRLSGAALWNADAVAPGLIAESIRRDGFGATVLGDVSSLSTLVLFLLTEPIPGHRILWQALPYAIALLAITLMALITWRLAGRWAAALTGALGICVGSDVLMTQLAPAFRVTTWLGIVICAGVAAWGAVRERVPVWALIGVGIITGVGIASDPLLGALGLVPLCFVLVRARRWARMGVVAIATAAAVAACLALMWALSLSTHRGNLLPVASPQEMITHLGQLWRGIIALLGAGDGSMVGAQWPAWWGVPALVAFWMGLVLIVMHGVRVVRRGSLTALDAYLLFWGILVVLLPVGFVLSGIPDVQAGILTDRYLVPLVLAVGAAGPILCASSPSRRAWGALGATALLATALVPLAQADLATHREAQPHVRQATAISAFVRAEGASRGGADFFTALPLRWHTGLDVIPVAPCAGDTEICLNPVNAREAWRAGPRAPRSFLIVNRALGTGRELAPVTGVVGRARRVRAFGPIAVFIYDGDITTGVKPWAAH